MSDFSNSKEKLDNLKDNTFSNISKAFRCNVLN